MEALTPSNEPAATGGSDGADPGLELPAEARGAGVGVHVAADLHRRLARRPVRRPLRRAALRHDCKMKIRAIRLSPYLTHKKVCDGIHEFAPAYYLLASGICLHGDVINLSLGLLSLHWSIKS